MKGLCCFLAFVLLSNLLFAQQFMGYVLQDDSFHTPIYQAMITVKEGNNNLVPIKSYYDGSFKLTVSKSKKYELTISYPGYKDSTLKFETNKTAQPSVNDVKITMHRDGLRLMGVVMDGETEFPIEKAVIILKNVMTRKEERLATGIDGYYNFKLEFETNYMLRIDKRSPGIVNKFGDTTLYISTLGFNMPLNYKMDIKLNRASTFYNQTPELSTLVTTNSKTKPIIEVKAKQASTPNTIPDKLLNNQKEKTKVPPTGFIKVNPKDSIQPLIKKITKDTVSIVSPTTSNPPPLAINQKQEKEKNELQQAALNAKQIREIRAKEIDEQKKKDKEEVKQKKLEAREKKIADELAENKKEQEKAIEMRASTKVTKPSVLDDDMPQKPKRKRKHEPIEPAPVLTELLGVVLNQLNSAPLFEASVSARKWGGDHAPHAFTDSLGKYRMKLEKDCFYLIETSKEGYLTLIDTLNTKLVADYQFLKTTYLKERNKEKPMELLPAISFQKNSSTLTDDGKHKLSEVIRELVIHDKVRVKLHALASCDETNPLQLSIKRSESIARYLEQSGVIYSRIKGLAYGDEKPRNACFRGSNCDERLLQENRCVEYELIRN